MNIVENIISVFDRATQEEVDGGILWYLEAQRTALEIGKGDLKLGAALLAVTSPMQKWERNVIVARYAMEHGKPYPGMKAIMSKVQRLIDGENPDDVVKGQKVTSFYRNIVNPFSDDVTIDRHAQDIAMDKRHTDSDRPGISKTAYAEFANAYREAASLCGVFPLELQAITWVAWRRELGIK